MVLPRRRRDGRARIARRDLPWLPRRPGQPDFVINCNLQCLDGPVRGNARSSRNSKATSRGADWNAINISLGQLLGSAARARHQRQAAQDHDGHRGRRVPNRKASGAYTREHFFGKTPETREPAASPSDDDIRRLNCAANDPHKVYAAYHSAGHEGYDGDPWAKTVILRHKAAGESLNPTHQQEEARRRGAVRRALMTASTSRCRTTSFADVPPPGRDSPEA